MTISGFQKLIWDYYKTHGRHDMVWRKTTNPYRILVSEVMLQQTQVSRVEGFYKNFIKQFPDFKALARAKTADVLRAWQGLGYNRRALLLQRLAQVVIKDHKGKLPRDRAVLELLPGIGKGTSGSLMAFAFNEPAIFIETNIRRIFIHHFFLGRTDVADSEIEPLVGKALDRACPREWYWALMDYGSHMKIIETKDTTETKIRKNKKLLNPNVRSKHYVRQSQFTGSDRELRGKLLKLFLEEKKLVLGKAAKLFHEPLARVEKIADALAKEGFLG